MIRMFAQNRQFMYALRHVKDSKGMNYFQLLYDECNSFYPDGSRIVWFSTRIQAPNYANFTYGKHNLLDKVYCYIQNTIILPKKCDKNQILINFDTPSKFSQEITLKLNGDNFDLMGIIDDEFGYVYFDYIYNNGVIESFKINQIGNIIGSTRIPIIKPKINDLADVKALTKVSYLYYLRRKTYEKYYL